MKVQSQDMYHGAVLTQITEHPSFKALNKIDSQYGHYLVNRDTRLLVKYSKKAEDPWTFKFKHSELQMIKHDLEVAPHVFLCLVCGEETICALNTEEFSQVINVNAPDSESQSIIVDAPEAVSMRVRGSAGRLGRTLAHNSFPNKLFEPME